MDLRIRQSRSRYRLPASQRAGASRLDTIARGLLPDALSGAIARAGAASDDEVCVRRARVALRVRATDSDADIAASWGVGVVAAIRKAAEEADPSNVVRYASRAQALVDFASSAASGDLTRQWAFRQLGFWRGPASDSAAVARAELFAALVAHPRAIVPTLAAVAQRGALAPLAATWSADHFRALAAAALRAADASQTLAEPGWASPTEPVDSAAREPAPSAPEPSPADPPTPSGAALSGAAPAAPDRAASTDGAGEQLHVDTGRALRAKATRALATSTLGVFLLDPRRVPAAVLEPFAVLAALHAEPASLRAGKANGERLVRAMLDVLRETRGRASRSDAHNQNSTSLRPTGDPRRAAVTSPRLQAANDTAAPSGPRAPGARAPQAAQEPPHAAQRAGAAPDAAPSSGSDAGRAPRSSSGPDRTARTRPGDTALAGAPRAPEAEQGGDRAPASPDLERVAEPWDVELRARGATRSGGLLFLLHIVAELDLAEAVAESPVLGPRPFRWSLHQLALALGEVVDDDPAALAFAGLGPDAEPPSWREEPATAPEHDEIARLASRVIARLSVRLDAGLGRPGTRAPSSDAAGPGSSDAASPEAAAKGRELVLRAVRRRAEILADPGWIEVRLALDEVTTDVRRAGLDLDPDYLPWLGVVLRFKYA